MASFLLDSFRGGFSEWEDKGISGSFKRGSALDIRKKVDSLTSQQALADEFTHANMTDLAIAIIPASNGKAYAFCRDGKIFERSSLGVWNTTPVYTDTAKQTTTTPVPIAEPVDSERAHHSSTSSTHGSPPGVSQAPSRFARVRKEVVVVDDCSTDGTWARILEAKERWPQVRAVDLGAAKVACFIMRPEGVRRNDRTINGH